MTEDVIAGRYARAFSRVAADPGAADRMAAEMEWVAELLTPGRAAFVPNLLIALLSPRLGPTEKGAVLGLLAEGNGIGDETAALLRLLVRKGRIALAPRIAARMRGLADERSKRATGDAESAKPLSPDQRRRVEEALGRILGLTVALRVRVRPELLGGLRVRIGNRQCDDSIAGRMERLRRCFAPA